MKRLNNLSFASRAMCTGIVILTMLATACKSGIKYAVYQYDNAYEIETYTDLNDGSTLTIDNRTNSGP